MHVDIYKWSLKPNVRLGWGAGQGAAPRTLWLAPKHGITGGVALEQLMEMQLVGL